MNWKNPWQKRPPRAQMNSVNVDKKVKQRWAKAMGELYGVNWQYHHGEHFDKALEMYLNFLEDLGGHEQRGDIQDMVSCTSLIKMLENDMNRELRKNKENWVKYRRKGETEKASFYDGVVKGINIAFNKTKLIKQILKTKE